jgi:hypothetical protein
VVIRGVGISDCVLCFGEGFKIEFDCNNNNNNNNKCIIINVVQLQSNNINTNSGSLC